MQNLPDNTAIINSLSFADDMISKSYLSRLSSATIMDPSEEERDLSVEKNMGFWKVSKLVVNKKEYFSEQLTSSLNAANTLGGSIVSIIKSIDGIPEIFIGVLTKQNRSNTTITKSTINAFDSALSGNLSGSEFLRLSTDKVESMLKEFECSNAVCSISGIPAFRDNAQNDILKYAQGIEHLLDSMQGQNFTVVAIADPISNQSTEQMRQGYELLYSQLSSLLKTQVIMNESDSQSLSKAQSSSITNSISKGIALTQSKSHTDGKFSAFSLGATAGINLGILASLNIGHSTGKNNAVTTGNTSTDSRGESTAVGTTNTSSVSTSKSIGKSIQLTYENRMAQSLLEKINKQLSRLDACKSLGAFECAVYVLAEEQTVARSAASNLNALLRAGDSYIENSVINTWGKSNDVNKLKQALQCLAHPRFKLDDDYKAFSNSNDLYLTASAVMTGKEATLLLGLPRQSVSGLPVLEMTPFGRSVPNLNYNKSGINIGKISHMSKTECNDVVLDTNSLAAHTFITGSTGSGKSNTIYRILDDLTAKNIPFLVIEPAKGEYKHVFGNRPNISVLATNAAKAPLLKINPFKFPADIHVLEHIDRLIEIFNVCWPMYAAMPAVLKDAVECAYKSCGWDLTNSVNRSSMQLYPSFADVLQQLHNVIDRSAFSQELKSNYIGALVTRVKSLTNGINGQIFCLDELGDELLFEQSCIIDLSRISSIETKALIMGIIIMRLQEHRLSSGYMNSPLRHVTVLEEAHHLLKRTSVEQSTESSNILGKSVEMLTNAIAEMRTYGEGFIIADQSPSMLDLSAIRNTNTKIILRLPDLTDRTLVGSAAGLTDDQVIELAKLPTGVAAVYQNNWLEPVLCSIERANISDKLYTYNNIDASPSTLKQDIIRYLLKSTTSENVEIDIDQLKETIANSNITADTKNIIFKAMTAKRVDMKKIIPAIAGLFNVDEILTYAPEAQNIDEWNDIILSRADFPLDEMSKECRDIVLFCIVSHRYEKNDNERLDAWMQHMQGRFLG